MGLSPYGRKPESLMAAVVASWQVPSSHNFRLMDPLGYAAGEAQLLRDGYRWMVGQTDCALLGIAFGSCFSCHRGQWMAMDLV